MLQRMLIALQRVQVVSILKHGIVVGEDFIKVSTFLDFSSLSPLICLLQLVGGLWNIVCSFAPF
jgi:hypothetical protein